MTQENWGTSTPNWRKLYRTPLERRAMGLEEESDGTPEGSVYDWLKNLFGGGSQPGTGPANNTPTPPNISNPPPGPFNQANIPGFDFTSYSDEDYQNLPVLRFLQGRMSPEEYANYAGGMATGAFGTELPLSGSMNMASIMEILQNPDAADVLRSLYRSGNLNWDSLVGLAAARAPAGGNAVPLSGIFT